MIAAAVLGSQFVWPNFSLVKALQADKDEYVRNSAFSALLDLAGVNFSIRIRETKRIDSGEISASTREINRILSELHIELRIQNDNQEVENDSTK